MLNFFLAIAAFFLQLSRPCLTLIFAFGQRLFGGSAKGVPPNLLNGHDDGHLDNFTERCGVISVHFMANAKTGFQRPKHLGQNAWGDRQTSEGNDQMHFS
jgi:hypothetical protein